MRRVRGVGRWLVVGTMGVVALVEKSRETSIVALGWRGNSIFYANSSQAADQSETNAKENVSSSSLERKVIIIYFLSEKFAKHFSKIPTKKKY